MRKLSLALEVSADLLSDFNKALDQFREQLKAAMAAQEYNRLCLAGVGELEIFYRVADDAVDGMQSAYRMESGLVGACRMLGRWLRGAAELWMRLLGV